MKRNKSIVTQSAHELAVVLGLSPLDAVELEVRSELNDRIIQIVHRGVLTHAQVASAAGKSRTRITAILNHNTHDVSTDLMLRIIAALGYRAKISMSKKKTAA